MSSRRARTLSIAEYGGEMRVFTVNAAIGGGQPPLASIAAPMQSWPRNRDRIRAAVTRCGLSWPEGEIGIATSPGAVDAGESSDLAVAVAILAASGQVPASAAQDVIFYAGLGDDGGLRPAPGVAGVAATAATLRPAALAVEASDIGYTARVPGLPVIGARTLAEVAAWLREAPEAYFPSLIRTCPPPVPDMATLPGNWLPRVAAEICAAGGHSLSLIGPPDSGAEHLAARLPGILPLLTADELAEVARLRKAAGVSRADTPASVPPLVTIGPDATMAELLGGGPHLSHPGAASLAHHGVLLLHHAPEIRREVLDALRQPLETGEVRLARGGPGGLTATFPARFLLVVSGSPCPCTANGTPPSQCQCMPATRRRYLGRLSGPLLDRVTVKATMTIPSERDAQVLSPCTATIAARVREARDRPARRLLGTPWRVNADIPADALRAFPVRIGALDPIERALDIGQVSQRGAVAVLRLAWTVADLNRNHQPGHSDVLAALGFYLGDHDWLSQYSMNRHFPVPH